MPMPKPLHSTPFGLDNSDAYLRWRDKKLEQAPTEIEQLIVEIGDPRTLTNGEYLKMRDIINRCNMVIYAGKTGTTADKGIPMQLGRAFGLNRLNHNWLADDDGITSLTVNDEGDHPTYIPYTNRAIHWHTDGYYNPMNKQIHGLLLHCVHSAENGGENAMMDHEMAYIHLREQNPDYIVALMQPDAMTIPPGTDMHGNARPAATGPVFSIDTATGALHMRYTARKRNIQWKDDPLTLEAVTVLEQLLSGDTPYIYRGRLEPGMGLVSNNALHNRAGFKDSDGQPKRLLYRARFFDRTS